MRIIEPITADEMVAAFLRTEITAFRYDEQILEAFARRLKRSNPGQHR
jgi:hypothetical protein